MDEHNAQERPTQMRHAEEQGGNVRVNGGMKRFENVNLEWVKLEI